MSASTPFFESVGQALATTDSLGSLRLLANRQLAKGVTRETLTVWFEQAREHFPDQEDRILEVLDLVARWCSPHQALDEPMEGKEMGSGTGFVVLESAPPLDVGKQG